jgi:predicted dehydrogenase
VLVCGAGSIGKRHIANLLQLGAKVSVWRKRSEMLDEVGREFPVQVCSDLSNAIAEAEAVVVATATDQHVAIAAEALEAGRALFIEKPVSHDWVGIDDLRSYAEGKIVEVGCQLRAHKSLVGLALRLGRLQDGTPLTYKLAMGHRLDAWRPTQDYRQGYSASSSRGGGALFDLIHQIDIALWLFGPATEVQAVLAKLSDFAIEGDDIANLLVTHESGITGHIQLDMASPVYRCDVEVMTNKAIFRWSSSDWMLRRQSPDGETIVETVPEGFQRNDLFLAHIAHWLKRMDDTKLSPLCSFEDGVAALRVALGARKASFTGQKVRI